MIKRASNTCTVLPPLWIGESWLFLNFLYVYTYVFMLFFELFLTGSLCCTMTQKSMASTSHSLFPCLDWVEATLDSLYLQQRCGKQWPNKHFCGMLVFCDCFDSISVSCFSLKPLHSTLSWPPCAFQPSLTSPLDWVEATLDSLCTEMWQTAEQQCPHFSWRSPKNQHCVFFVTPLTQCRLMELEQSIASTAPFVPIQDCIHPSLLWLSLLYH